MGENEQAIAWELWAAYHNGAYPNTPSQVIRAEVNLSTFNRGLAKMGYTIDRRKGQFFKLTEPAEAASTILHFEPAPTVGDILILNGEFVWYGYDRNYVRAVSPHGAPARKHYAGDWAIIAPESCLPEGWEYIGAVPAGATL